MGQIQLLAEMHVQRLEQARQLFFNEGTLPDGLIDPVILRSWERCRRFGLGEGNTIPAVEAMDRVALKTEQDRNRFLLAQGRPIMEHVFEQIRDSGSMVILAAANGLLLETVGDADFVSRADRVTLSAGASWDENLRGTNAIGTALAEEGPVSILGGEHFLEHNAFLTCCATPIFAPDGRLIGVLDISGDYRSHQHHTLGLVRMSSAIVERRLFESLHARDVLVCFHTRADYLGSPKEGIAAVTPDGQVLAINRNGTDLLGIRQVDAVRRDFSMVFESNLSALIDRLRHIPQGSYEINVNGKTLHVRLRGQLPPLAVAGRVYDEPSAIRAPRRPEAIAPSGPTLDTLNTGDARLQAAIERARRILGKDIPILIQGETGAGKEMFAKGFHNSGPRSAGPFVALNCASIPETLIESELFGYQGGAFTGARKEGAPGKIQQAHGGTLFLDEIGELPITLQVKLLRLLETGTYRRVGGLDWLPADFRLICATHRDLRAMVQAETFRRDLYFRINTFPIHTPALHERAEDIPLLAISLLERVDRKTHRQFSPAALTWLSGRRYSGNIRELRNLIERATLLADGATVDLKNLTEMADDIPAIEINASGAFQLAEVVDLATLEKRYLDWVKNQPGVDLATMAGQLGVSQRTLYRELQDGRGGC